MKTKYFIAINRDHIYSIISRIYAELELKNSMIKKRKKLFKKIIHLMDLIVTFIRFSGSFIIFALFAFVLSSRPLGKDTLKYIELFIPLLSLAIVNICTTVAEYVS